MRAKTHGLSRSIQTRLVAHARTLGVETELVLTRYAVERFLYRLSRSPYAERFILKGALLMLAWLGETIRPTRDADLLGSGELSDQALAGIFREVCVVDVEPDAVAYDPNSLRIDPIRDEDAYGGRRVKIRAQSGSARVRVQVDVGIGDAVSPGPEWLEYPSLLDLPRPRLMAYRPETFLAEKVHAIVVLGSNNSRMRDFFDIYALTRFKAFNADLLAGALRATFERRRTAIPDWPPSALKPGFSASREKQAQWRAFLAKSALPSDSPTLAEVAERLAQFMEPAIKAARTGTSLGLFWRPGGSWEPER